jgi:S1-C subfamily serine protease
MMTIFQIQGHRHTQRYLALISGIFSLVLATNPVTADTDNLGSISHPSPVSPIETSTVKIFTTRVLPDVLRPWTTQPPNDITGSGVVITGKRILTNAHVVLYARQIEIQDNLSGDKKVAHVEAISRGIDLAILKLDDESFFDSHSAIAFSESLPEIKNQVLVYGYPTGGNSLSITKGIVSRIDFSSYTFPLWGLRIQIDAAINPGNSGGPTIIGDNIIGLATSTLVGAQNIGYIIPTEEIQLFLNGAQSGGYKGKLLMYDEFQTLENPSLRIFLKLDSSVHGVVITKPYNGSNLTSLKKWDVITKIGDTPVDDQGMVLINTNTRLRFQYIIQKMPPNNFVPLTIIRDGLEMKVNEPISAERPRVLPSLDGAPRYFIFGPVVFSVATEELLQTAVNNKDYGSKYYAAFSAMGNPMLGRRGEDLSQIGEELVVISSPLFPHKLSLGYSNPQFKVVRAINGEPVKNLKNLVELLRDSHDQFIAIEFMGSLTETIVLPREAALAATGEILADNGIRDQGSPDIMQVWNQKQK